MYDKKLRRKGRAITMNPNAVLTKLQKEAVDFLSLDKSPLDVHSGISGNSNTDTRASVFLIPNAGTTEAGLLCLHSLLDTPCTILHDPNGAPYIDSANSEIRPHISLTDETPYSGAAAVLSSRTSPLRGIGIDIASANAFTPELSSFDKQFFHASELELLHATAISPALTKALLFSFKESAVKSLADCARPFIMQDPTCFDAIDFRQFEITLTGSNTAVISATDAAAATLPQLDIHHLEGLYLLWESYVVTFVKAMYK